MNNNPPSQAELIDAIELATRQAVNELFAQHAEQFYYLTLITGGEALSPVLSAWSVEALERAISIAADKDEARFNLEWCYASSPYFCFGEEYFREVERLFDLRPDIDSFKDDSEESWQAEYELRLGAMEEALARLDRTGMFGIGEARNRIVVNAEVMPPDYSNTVRAQRLNPPAAIRDWLIHVAEY
jgi:hypothetical protein